MYLYVYTYTHICIYQIYIYVYVYHLYIYICINVFVHVLIYMYRDARSDSALDEQLWMKVPSLSQPFGEAVMLRPNCNYQYNCVVT